MPHQISGKVPLNFLDRLLTSLISDEGEVSVDIRFSEDITGRKELHFQIATTLQISCEICKKPLIQAVQLSTTVKLIKDLKSNPNDFEVIELDEHDQVDVYAYVEDELILSLPLFPHHPDSCPMNETH